MIFFYSFKVMMRRKIGFIFLVGVFLLILSVLISPRIYEEYLYHSFFGAVDVGNVNKVIRLIDKGIDVNDKMENDRTALHDIAYSMVASNEKSVPNLHRVEITQILIDNGAEIDPLTNREQTPLHLAAFCGQHEVADILIRNGANVNAQDLMKYTPLHHAVESYCSGHRKHYILFIQTLIKYGADVNAQDVWGETPLHLTTNDDLELVEFFIENGADPMIKDDLGNTVLDLMDDENRVVLQEILNKQGEYKVE